MNKIMHFYLEPKTDYGKSILDWKNEYILQ